MSSPARYDVKTELEDYRARRGEFRLLEVPRRHFLMIDGQGDPRRAHPSRLRTILRQPVGRVPTLS